MSCSAGSKSDWIYLNENSFIMKRFEILFFIAFFLFYLGCDQDISGPMNSDFTSEFGISGVSGESSSSNGSNIDGTNNNNTEPGLITAGEWNDLDNWDFWKQLLKKPDFEDKPEYWNFQTEHRISILVLDGQEPVMDALVELHVLNEVAWEGRTDNQGKAEMWINLFSESNQFQHSIYTLTLQINGIPIDREVKFFDEGLNIIQMGDSHQNLAKVELAFIVDATGSMSDEMEFLKDDLASVIQRVASENPSLDIRTASVFYRDEGDEYLVKHSDFTDDLGSTISFIRDQVAGGGGDFPEAVHTAMRKGIEELHWSNLARTRIAFLLLDAPPHYKPWIVDELHELVQKYARFGIKIIPITASGIDKETEFLMRFFAISTNGTYVFITDHSGIGNDHLEASVGDYEVEYLNDLMVRLIIEYSE